MPLITYQGASLTRQTAERALSDADITLVANPRSAREPIEALTAAILDQAPR